MQNMILQKIQSLEEEIKVLKSLSKKNIVKKKTGKKNEPLSIEGLLKGVTFTEKEIEEAQKAIFTHSENHIK